MRSFVACALAASALGLSTLATPGPARAEAAGGGLTLSSLLARFAAMPGLEARFREEKRIALLEAPLVSEGTIHFSPPSTLLRRITSPSPQTVLITEGQLRYRDGSRAGQVDLEANPLVRHFVESFVLLLAGDEAALRRLYDVTLRPREGDEPESWELSLRPRLEAMGRVLREVRLLGHGVILERTQVVEVSGDETLTTFTDVDPTRRYDAAEQRRLFRIPR